MKILVTGYQGFIGQNLCCKYLAHRGHEVEGWEYMAKCSTPSTQVDYDWVYTP